MPPEFFGTDVCPRCEGYGKNLDGSPCRCSRKQVLGFSCGHWDEFNIDPECLWSPGDTVACGQCNDLALVVTIGEVKPEGAA